MKALYTAATGMTAQQARLDNIANNLANVNTTGYKRQAAAFQDLLYQDVAQGGGQGEGSSVVQIGGGVRIVGNARDHRSGSLKSTEQPLDMALVGDGFFQLESEDGELRYTRDGAFGLDEEGRLISASGMVVSGDIQVDPEAGSVEVQADGSVRQLTADGSSFTSIGQMTVVRFLNPAGLEALGGNLYMGTPGSGEPEEIEVGVDVDIKQGYLESSNVNVATELIGMIEAQRAYELTSKMVQASDEAMQTAVNLKR